MSVTDILEGLRSARVPALARAISMVENGRPGYEELLSTIHEEVGGAHRIGITGPPGAGKSTLTERLIHAYRERGKRVAVVAVDPTSPISGGALLGDRIRMESVALDPDVFIRSMATRGEVGGLATTTREVCDVLDAFGFERILIETVGVGQSELTIAATADTAVLVLVPESGDGVQVLKAGVMEVADLYAVNKADRPGADRLRQEIDVMLGIRAGQAYRHIAPHHRPGAATKSAEQAGQSGPADPMPVWEPPVLTTSAVKNEGVDALVEAIERHAQWLASSGQLAVRRRERLRRHTREVVDRSLREWVWEDRDGEARLAAGLEQMAAGGLTPWQLAHDIVTGLREESTNGK